MSIGPYIIFLPDIALEKIFSFLSYDEIARNREVCTKFNDVGSNLLSRGFLQIERRHAAIYKRVKSLLPRRESERRAHPLFRHCDILSAVDTRISMLNMTYSKYIQNEMCCFIPGKVLDELERVLNVVEKPTSPPRANEILQELRDISSMAMEYFDEKILPVIKGPVTPTTSSYTTPATATKAPKVFYIQSALQDENKKLVKINKRQCAHNMKLSKDVQKMYKRIERQKNRIKVQSAIIRDNVTKMQQQETRANEQAAAIAALQKHVAEWDKKLATLKAEVVSSREDIVKAIFPLPAEINQNNPPAQTHKTVIRPRVAQVQTPNTYISELERKRKASMDVDIPNKLRFIMKQDSNALTLKEQVSNKIDENITQNISKNILDDVEDTSKKKYDFTSLLSSSMDAIIRNSIGNIKPRKRRYTSDGTEADVLVNLH